MIRLFFYPHFTEGELRHRKAKEFDAIIKKKVNRNPSLARSKFEAGPGGTDL